MWISWKIQAAYYWCCAEGRIPGSVQNPQVPEGSPSAQKLQQLVWEYNQASLMPQDPIVPEVTFSQMDENTESPANNTDAMRTSAEPTDGKNIDK